MRSNRSQRFALALFASVLCGHSAHAQIPTTRFVATNSAFNSTGCGTRERPCRTITQAILNSVDGDLIEVGPGTYQGTITIDKRVEIYSAVGAALTLIEGTTLPRSPYQVHILAGGVTFGRLNSGFTLVGIQEFLGGITGIDVGGGQLTQEFSDVTISGNIIVNHFTGISISEHARRTRIEGNTAIHNPAGFAILGPESVLINNVASDSSQFGFVVVSSGTTFTDNVALGNEVGIEAGALEAGAPFSYEFRGNTVIGNSLTGFRIRARTGGQVVLRGNNIYGNGDGAAGCGVINAGGIVDAINNYWGKADGPGPNPGDRAYGQCLASGNTLTKPFATTPFPLGPHSQ